MADLQHILATKTWSALQAQAHQLSTLQTGKSICVEVYQAANLEMCNLRRGELH
jgi:hypothetical protein